MIPLPDGMSLFDAMALGTAGFTAALAIHRMEQNGQKPAMGPIVVTGASGGVGSIAIDLLREPRLRGRRRERQAGGRRLLKSLGAAKILRRQDIDLGKRPMEAAQWGGAVDNVGGEILTWLTRTVDNWGNIASIGLAASHKLETTVMPFILRGVSLLGINSSAMPRDVRIGIWKRLATDLKPRHLDKIVTRTIAFAELPRRFRRFREGPGHGAHRRQDRLTWTRAIAARLVGGARRRSASRSRRRRWRRSWLMAELADWNTRLNLTAITAPAEVVDKHLLDSLAVLPLLRGLQVADIGSGAGFPGLPLAIADLDRRYTLIESTGKKVKFMPPRRSKGSSSPTWTWSSAGRSPTSPRKPSIPWSRGPSARSPSSCGWPGTWRGGRPAARHEGQGPGAGAEGPAAGLEGARRAPCRRPRTGRRALSRRTW